MKKIFYLFFVFTLLFSCKTANLFGVDSAEIPNSVDTIPLNFRNNLPLVNVTINRKEYVFLFDTGAPTVISSSIYNDLHLKPSAKNTITDSQNNKNKQIFTTLPNMKVENSTFNNIGCVVVDFDVSELSCYNIQGILGANQMASVFWKVDYKNQVISVTKDLQNFNLDEYTTILSFRPKSQKTPLIKATLLDETITYTFDTGFSGNIKFSDDNTTLVEKIKQFDYIETFGVSAVGVYGGGENETEYTFKADTITIDSIPFKNEIIETGKSSLIGNDFLKKFIFILDWHNQKVYLKQIDLEEKNFSSFGFGYRFIENVPTVSNVFNIEEMPVKIGDIILKINDTNLEDLDTKTACEYYINRIAKDAKAIDITLKRNDSILNYHLEKRILLK